MPVPAVMRSSGLVVQVGAEHGHNCRKFAEGDRGLKLQDDVEHICARDVCIAEINDVLPKLPCWQGAGGWPAVVVCGRHGASAVLVSSSVTQCF